MEKGFRRVVCSGRCKKTLKIGISERQYGKTVEFTCPICSEKMRVFVPVPSEMSQTISESDKKDQKEKNEPFDINDLKRFEDLFGGLGRKPNIY